MSRKLLVIVFSASMLSSALFAMDEPQKPPKEERVKGDKADRPKKNPSGIPPVIELGEKSIYIYLDGIVKRLDKNTLKELAEIDIEKLEEGDNPKDAFDTLDANGDGTLTPDEFPPLNFMLDRIDQNHDGVVTKDEVPQEILDRFSGANMKRMLGGQASIKIDKGDASVFVYTGGTLYRLNGDTLKLEAKAVIQEAPANPMNMFMRPMGKGDAQGGMGGGAMNGGMQPQLGKPEKMDKGRRQDVNQGAPEDFAAPVF